MCRCNFLQFNMKPPQFFSMCTGLGFCVSAQQTVCQGFYNILPSSPYIDVPLTHKHKNSKINTNTRYKDIRSSYIYRGNPGRRRLRFPKQTLEHSCGATVLLLQLTKERGNHTVTQVSSTLGQKEWGVSGSGPSVRSAWLPLPASPATVSHSAPSRHEPHGWESPEWVEKQAI